MIKVYSITEIIKASEAILAESSIKKKQLIKQSTLKEIKNTVLDIKNFDMQRKIDKKPKVYILNFCALNV